MNNISLCIPTLNRYDTFLSKYLPKYTSLLERGIINEIIISDENGNDYEKLLPVYGDNPKIKLYKNDHILGVFENKLKVCSYASSEYIALIDSDNFCDETYFATIKKYIDNHQSQLSKHVILSPSFSKPVFNHSNNAYTNQIITTSNISSYVHNEKFQILLNTGNFVITKSIIECLKYDKSIMKSISACDVLYFNLLCFQQYIDFQFHVVKDLEYLHVVHNDSEYIKTHHNCDNYRDSILLPKYYLLNNEGLCRIKDERFYVKNGVTYPPFKNGKYMEEYFLNFMGERKMRYNKNGRLYIPALWTNFQITSWFNNCKQEMQSILDQYIKQKPCDEGYFTVVQYDDGPLLTLPSNTLIYGACSGNIILPLIYEDVTNRLASTSHKSFNGKSILCSFIGSNTHNVRRTIYNKFKDNTNFIFHISNWTTEVGNNNQDKFINTTINSKFALSPRGYGRSSFRFFEILLLETIPVYIWDDIEWLPYKDIIDYTKFCISINISDIDKLESILTNINETKYNEMLEEYHKIKHVFTLDYMCKYITGFDENE